MDGYHSRVHAAFSRYCAEFCPNYAGFLRSVKRDSIITQSRTNVTLIALFRQTARLMVAELVERLDSAGYSDLPAAYHPIFENLDAAGTRLTELAARTDMTHQSMGELIDTLQQRGYVERQPDPSDRRARLVRLTAKGRRMVRVALREIADIEANWSHAWEAAGLRADMAAVLKAAADREEARRDGRELNDLAPQEAHR